MPQHLSHCIGFLLYGMALEPGGGAGVGWGGAGGVVGVGQGAWWGWDRERGGAWLVCTYSLRT